MADDKRALLWAEARRLVGTRFRLHGRDPATGLDCVGLVLAAYARAGMPIRAVPDDYALHGATLTQIEAGLKAAGFDAGTSAPEPGDVALIMCGHGQHHLALIGPSSHIHAHAGLRRVVETPGWPENVLGYWRRRTA